MVVGTAGFPDMQGAASGAITPSKKAPDARTSASTLRDSLSGQLSQQTTHAG